MEQCFFVTKRSSNNHTDTATEALDERALHSPTQQPHTARVQGASQNVDNRTKKQNPTVYLSLLFNVSSHTWFVATTLEHMSTMTAVLTEQPQPGEEFSRAYCHFYKSQLYITYYMQEKFSKN